MQMVFFDRGTRTSANASSARSQKKIPAVLSFAPLTAPDLIACAMYGLMHRTLPKKYDLRECRSYFFGRGSRMITELIVVQYVLGWLKNDIRIGVLQ